MNIFDLEAGVASSHPPFPPGITPAGTSGAGHSHGYGGGAARHARTAETDPNGKDLNSPGAKADAGKVRPGLVLGGFARALVAVSDVGTYGAKKYTDGGWVEVPNGEARYTDAMVRHWLSEKQGELRDPDTELLHAAHLAWNALARLDLILRRLEKEAAQ